MKPIAFILIFVLPLGCRQEGAVLSKVMPDDEIIANTLKAYHQMTGELPTTEQGLSALVARPDDLPLKTAWVQLAQEVPIDPWNNKYEYKNTSANGGKEPTFEIRSLGQDGVRSDDDLVSTFRINQSYPDKTD